MCYYINMEENQKLSENLVKFRKKAGMSQLDLAEKLNYSNKNISKWENGETTPNVFILQKIAQVYGITVDALLSGEVPEEDSEVVEQIKSRKAKRVKIFRLAMLVLANVILFAVGSVAIYVLGLLNVSAFNKWLIYFYLLPLSFLSVNIYIRVLYKYVDIITLSFMGWLICGAVYVSLRNVHNMALIFVVGAAYQLIVIGIAVLINIHLPNKFTKFLRLDKIKNWRKRKKQTKEQG